MQIFLNDDANLRHFTDLQEEFIRQWGTEDVLPLVAWGTTQVTQALREGHQASLIYLYCHGVHMSGMVKSGAFASESALYFGGKERIDLTELRNLVSATFPARPLVFLNACEGGTQDVFYYDGFMPFFVEERGARGFIGTEVKAPQLLAHDFALNFLRSFAEGEPVGQILWKLRRHYLNHHHTILAFNYSLYGLNEIRLATPLPSVA
jgi:hypothetical protein